MSLISSVFAPVLAPALSALPMLAQAGPGGAPPGRGSDGDMPSALLILLVVGGGVAALAGLIVIMTFGQLWLRAWFSGCYVPMLRGIMGMWLRKVNPTIIVDAKIMATKAGLPIETDMIETHYLARGNVQSVVRALVAASKANIELPWERACAIDLAGRDVLDAVRTSVHPKVIDCPDPTKGRQMIEAVAKDGIMLKAKARVTVRTNLPRLVGGATEETVIARVGEGIVSTIGSAENYKMVLENPDTISKRVLAKGLDAGTAFEILSIDIADVDVGENVGARLQAEQAEADKRVAQAKAEERRAMAVAREQEMQALVRENRAKVVLAESEVPKAIAQAFRDGNLGVMDYYNLRNVQADTTMRANLGGQDARGDADPDGRA